jgi:molybdopterin synthase sulfur carrier subunit
MKIKIKYFGMLTDITSCEEEIIDFSGVLISELLEVLFIKYPNLKTKTFKWHKIMSWYLLKQK